MARQDSNKLDALQDCIKWARKNYSRLQALHKGNIIAIAGKKVIACTRTGGEMSLKLEQILKTEGLPHPAIILDMNKERKAGEVILG